MSLLTLLRDLFRRPAAKLQVGALCLREQGGQREVLMISSRGRGVWLLPKGWPMRGKTMAEAALVEAWEEAGVQGRADDRPRGSYRYRKREEARLGPLCEVVVYAVEEVTLAERYPEAGQRERRWIPLPEAARIAGERGLRRFLKSL